MQKHEVHTLQAAKAPDGSMDLVARVRRIFDEDFPPDSLRFDSEGAQVSNDATPEPDQRAELNLRPDNSISEANISTQACCTIQVTVPPSVQDDPVPNRQEAEQLISRETRLASNSAFNNLAQPNLIDNVRTLEDLVGQMLPPILKSWMDNNLPMIVEDLLRLEIDGVLGRVEMMR